MRTVGTSSQPDLTVVIMMFSTGVALLGFAPVITDYMLENCFKNSKRSPFPPAGGKEPIPRFPKPRLAI